MGGYNYGGVKGRKREIGRPCITLTLKEPWRIGESVGKQVMWEEGPLTWEEWGLGEKQEQPGLLPFIQSRKRKPSGGLSRKINDWALYIMMKLRPGWKGKNETTWHWNDAGFASVRVTKKKGWRAGLRRRQTLWGKGSGPTTTTRMRTGPTHQADRLCNPPNLLWRSFLWSRER